MNRAGPSTAFVGSCRYNGPRTGTSPQEHSKFGPPPAGRTNAGRLDVVSTSPPRREPHPQLLVDPRQRDPQLLEALLEGAPQTLGPNYDHRLIAVDLELEATLKLAAQYLDELGELGGDSLPPAMGLP